MTQDITQWLAEIKLLQQQLAEAQREREDAYSSAANWRKLYETEAQQRRIEANLSRQTIELLKAEIRQLQGMPQPAPSDATSLTATQQMVEQLQSVEDLRLKLVEALVERDRFLQALKAEQAEHAQTRKSLTTALADTVDMLSKEEGA